MTGSLLTPVEVPLLRWLSAIVAPRLSADGCTVVGVIGAVVCCLGYALSNYATWYIWPATIGAALHWLGDSLDGTVARLRGTARPRYGFYVDHFADTVCQVLIFLGLGLSPFVSFSVACVSLVAYQSLAILVFLRTSVLGEFRLSFGKIGPTEGHALLILVGISILIFGPVRIGGSGASDPSAYDVVVGAFGVLAAFHFIRTGLRETLLLRARDE